MVASDELRERQMGFVLKTNHASNIPDIEICPVFKIAPEEIIAHKNSPVAGKHMPLLTTKWDLQSLNDFIEAKEACWHRDGLGHLRNRVQCRMANLNMALDCF